MRSIMRPEYSGQPASTVQRSQFDLSHGHKTAFDAGYLIPLMWLQTYPGDVISVSAQALARLATPLFPTMDNLKLTIHFWSCPNRLIWTNWRKFCGEREDPADSIDYTVPVITSTHSGSADTIYDYFGIPVGQAGAAFSHSALPFRAYNKIYNEHYRNQLLIDSVAENTGDGTDATGDYTLLRRGKRADYFTTALPSPQKGDSVSLPLGTTAPVVGIGIDTASANANTNTTGVRESDGGTDTYAWTSDNAQGLGSLWVKTGAGAGEDPQIFADLSQASSATINALRQSFAIQQHLEMDARGGSRYAEIIWVQFGTEFQDVRYRPEYLGGGVTDVVISPIANQSGSAGDLGDLAAIGTARVSGIGFTKAFDEHCQVLAIGCVDADLTYQQGLDRQWSKSTRYDFFWPSFAFIGDQAIESKEIFCDGSASDDDVFGYAPRYEEERTKRSLITGKFRSNAAGTLEAWHYSEDFASRPTLGQTFNDSNPPIDRTIAVQTEPHFIFDSVFKISAARPIPLNGIPGMTRL